MSFLKHLKLLIALPLKLWFLNLVSSPSFPFPLLLTDPVYSAAFDLFLDCSSSRVSNPGCLSVSARGLIIPLFLEI